MRTALITTTINIPTVLRLYRRLDPDVRFFVAADRKTNPAAYEFCVELGNTKIIPPDRHGDLPYAPFNSIQRRNIALLEALKWGADVIVSVDDDNAPLDKNYFLHTGKARGKFFSGFGGGFEAPQAFSGVQAYNLSGWFDVGQFLDPVSPHRGYPVDCASQPWYGPVTDAKIGVAAGICLGDPDILAVTRIARAPTVHRVSELLRAGIVVDPITWTVFNSQNTAICRELAPAWMMVPGISRYDDIIASLIVQRVGRERGYHVHFGQPFVWQQRNTHNLVTDLEGEMWGMNYVADFANVLNGINLPGKTVLDDVRTIWTRFAELAETGVTLWLPEAAWRAGLAWCDAVEKVL
jgi:hypothetical protein